MLIGVRKDKNILNGVMDKQYEFRVIRGTNNLF
jgi:hypothetical protein